LNTDKAQLSYPAVNNSKKSQPKSGRYKFKMTKSDKSKHSICIASIKRSTIKPYDFKWTKFYESNSDFPYSGLQFDLIQDELIICSTVIDGDNYSILTTRRLITKQNGQTQNGNIEGAIDKLFGDFKGYIGKTLTFGQIQLQSGVDLNYHIETGKASMIMVQGIRTLLKVNQMTDK
jgi:hypothetical protein